MMLPVKFHRLEVVPSGDTPGWFTARLVVRTELGQEITMYEDDYLHPGQATDALNRQLRELLTNA